MVYEFDGTKYERLRGMRAARRAKRLDPVRGGMDEPKRIDAGYLCMDKRIAIADLHRAGSGVRAIARTPGGAPSTNENTNGLPRQYSPPREPTRPDTPRNTSTQPPWNPTTGLARPWTT